MRASYVALVAIFLVGCSSGEESSSPGSSPSTSTTPMATTSTDGPSTSSAPSTTSIPPTTVSNQMTIECDADSGESPTFEIPLGMDVTLVARSSTEREFHLHGYDIELTGTEVSFQFTADLPGPHELTEHPDHTTVCTIVSP